MFNPIKRLFPIAIMALFVSNLCAQPTFNYTFGGNDEEFAFNAIETPDGGYAIIGTTKSWGAGGYDVFLVKLNSLGLPVFTRTYGGNKDEWGYDIANTMDGGFIITGFTYSYTLGGQDMYVIKTDDEGMVEWAKTYGDPNNSHSNDWGKAIIPLADSGFIVGGTLKTDKDFLAVRIDKNGDFSWSYQYGTSNHEQLYDAVLLADSSVLLMGDSKFPGTAKQQSYVVKIDLDGNVLSNTSSYGLTAYDEYSHCYGSATPDSGFVYMARTNGLSVNGTGIIIYKVDKNMAIEWSYLMDGSGNEEPSAIITTADGGYMLVGYSNSTGSGYDDFLLGKLNSTGNAEWLAMYGGTDKDYGINVLQSSLGHFLVVGHTKSFGAGKNDIYAIMVDTAASNSCNYGNVIPLATFRHDTAAIRSDTQVIIDVGIANNTPIIVTDTIDRLPDTICYFLLPVKLSALSAKNQDADIFVDWRVAFANDLRSFEVEHFRDGEFEFLGEVDYDTETPSYRFTDFEPPPGKHIYRLKYRYHSGKYAYSPLVNATIGAFDNLQVASLFPNPVYKGADAVIYMDHAFTGDIVLYSLMGEYIWNVQVDTTAGASILIPTDNLVRGFYFVQINTGQSTSVIPFEVH